MFSWIQRTIRSRSSDLLKQSFPCGDDQTFSQMFIHNNFKVTKYNTLRDSAKILAALSSKLFPKVKRQTHTFRLFDWVLRCPTAYTLTNHVHVTMYNLIPMICVKLHKIWKICTSIISKGYHFAHFYKQALAVSF